MGDIVGRDKNVQHGQKSKMKIDNRAYSGDGWIKSITIGVILLIIGYIFKFFLGF
jgi:hypothetical protein